MLLLHLIFRLLSKAIVGSGILCPTSIYPCVYSLQSLIQLNLRTIPPTLSEVGYVPLIQIFGIRRHVTLSEFTPDLKAREYASSLVDFFLRRLLHILSRRLGVDLRDLAGPLGPGTSSADATVACQSADGRPGRPLEDRPSAGHTMGIPRLCVGPHERLSCPPAGGGPVQRPNAGSTGWSTGSQVDKRQLDIDMESVLAKGTRTPGPRILVDPPVWVPGPASTGLEESSRS